MATTALVREVPDSFVDAIVAGERPSLDADAARKQHAEYVAMLASAGYTIETVAADEAHPDCPFIEDVVVIVGEVALITRCGAAARRGERDPVADVLRDRFELAYVEAPGTLDGGDVFRVGTTLYVGQSSRTNNAGIDQLRTVATTQHLDVVPVTVHDALHLKTAVHPLGDAAVLVTDGGADISALRDLDLVYEDRSERYCSSVLPLRDGQLLASAGAPRTSTLLDAMGYDVSVVDVSQFRDADGGVTCLSVLF